MYITQSMMGTLVRKFIHPVWKTAFGSDGVNGLRIASRSHLLYELNLLYYHFDESRRIGTAQSTHDLWPENTPQQDY